MACCLFITLLVGHCLWLYRQIRLRLGLSPRNGATLAASNWQPGTAPPPSPVGRTGFGLAAGCLAVLCLAGGIGFVLTSDVRKLETAVWNAMGVTPALGICSANGSAR